MRGRTSDRAKVVALAAGLAGLLMAGAAQAASYEFVPAPQADLNRVYRVDKATGEVISCQYGLQENTIGTTLCFGPGEGAGPQAPSEYSLVASRHLREAGVFRVNQRTGAMSICYVLDDAVVCTPQGNAGSVAPAAKP
ncbi:hypothetical protein FF100_06280 [Methylobacterium terricola]|uniref:Secreted protein n=1 Tax=Methylobacterium terricola TaxID=2583531 RepID=A0A5C4LNV0_9HYPH|nr:hypothetical protein [Methylobacterium terricola]TNC15161.1 hypothetical protein FF100_06280 [Methylobacterium terricola]